MRTNEPLLILLRGSPRFVVSASPDPSSAASRPRDGPKLCVFPASKPTYRGGGLKNRLSARLRRPPSDRRDSPCRDCCVFPFPVFETIRFSPRGGTWHIP